MREQNVFTEVVNNCEMEVDPRLETVSVHKEVEYSNYKYTGDIELTVEEVIAMYEVLKDRGLA